MLSRQRGHKCEQALLTMKAVRRHDGDCIDVVARANLAEVCRDGRYPEAGRHGLRARRIAAAQCDHLGVGVRLNSRQVAVGGKRAGADHGNPQSARSRHRMCARCRRPPAAKS
jgi:hypothetical protein